MSHFADTRSRSREVQESYQRPARTRTTGTSDFRRNRLGLNKPAQSQATDIDISPIPVNSPTYKRPTTFEGLAKSHRAPIKLREGTPKKEPISWAVSPAFDHRAEVKTTTSPAMTSPAFDEVAEADETTTTSMTAPDFDEPAAVNKSTSPSMIKPIFDERAKVKTTYPKTMIRSAFDEQIEVKERTSAPVISRALEERAAVEEIASPPIIKPALNERAEVEETTSPVIARLAFDHRAKVKPLYTKRHNSSSSASPSDSPVPSPVPHLDAIAWTTRNEKQEELFKQSSDEDVLPESAFDAMGARLKNSENHMKDAKRLLDRVDRVIDTKPDISTLNKANETSSLSNTTNMNISISVPRLWRRDNSKFLGITFTWLGLILTCFVIWFITENIMCEFFCHPLYASKPVAWSPSDPFFPYAIPTKLDQWTGKVGSRLLRWFGGILEAAWRAAMGDSRTRGREGGRRRARVYHQEGWTGWPG